MIGTRGIPATYGGVEHHVEAVGARLAARGHDVTVFSETAYVGPQARSSHLGMRVVRIPSLKTKHFEALTHSFLSTLATTARPRYDVVHYHAVGPGIMSPLPQYLTRLRVVQTIHGLDADRAKWSSGAQRCLSLATWVSARVPDVTVTVSDALREHYLHRYGRQCVHVPNGVDRRPRRAPDLITRRHGLEGQDYVLFVGRLVPEKAPDLLLRAFAEIDTDMHLVIAGGSSHTGPYVREVEQLAAADPRVTMLGYVYGDELDELYTNAAVFVLPSFLEGLPLTLLEAIESEVPVVASDIPPHAEVLDADGPGGRLFPPGDVHEFATVLARVLRALPSERDGCRPRRDRVLSIYDWDRTVDGLEEAYGA